MIVVPVIELTEKEMSMTCIDTVEKHCVKRERKVIAQSIIR